MTPLSLSQVSASPADVVKTFAPVKRFTARVATLESRMGEHIGPAEYGKHDGFFGRVSHLEQVGLFAAHARLAAFAAPASWSAEVLGETFTWQGSSRLEDALAHRLADVIPTYDLDERSTMLMYQPLICEWSADELENMPLSLAVICLMWDWDTEIENMVRRRGGPDVPNFRRSGRVDLELFQTCCEQRAAKSGVEEYRFVWRNLPHVFSLAIQETGNPFLDANHENMRPLEELPCGLTMRTVRAVATLARQAEIGLTRAVKVCETLDAHPELWDRIWKIWRVVCPRGEP